MDFNLLPSQSANGDWNVVIETPKGSRNKYKFEEKYQNFSLSGVLPAGHSFPYDFGFIPKTLGEDGDPLDVLLFMEEPVFPGCIVETRLIGVIEARQTDKDGESNRNDRILAVSVKSPTHSKIKKMDDLEDNLVKEIDHFFISYNESKGKKFEILGHKGSREAVKLVKQGIKNAKEK